MYQAVIFMHMHSVGSEDDFLTPPSSPRLEDTEESPRRLGRVCVEHIPMKGKIDNLESKLHSLQMYSVQQIWDLQSELRQANQDNYEKELMLNQWHQHTLASEARRRELDAVINQLIEQLRTLQQSLQSECNTSAQESKLEEVQRDKERTQLKYEKQDNAKFREHNQELEDEVLRLKFALKQAKQCEEFIKQVEEAALNNGEVSRKLAHGIFVGPTGSGKSSLMDRLLGRPRKQFSPSTGVAEPVVVVDVSINNPSTFHSVTVVDKSTWKEIECNESFIRQMDRTNIRKASRQPVRRANVSGISNTDLAPSTTSADVPDSSNTMPSLASVSADVSTNASTSDRVDAVKIQPVTRETVRHMISTTIKQCGGFEKFMRFLEESFTLYLRDTGGQVEFQEMIPLLVFGPSIFFFVFRLDLDFKKKFEVKYRKRAGESLNCYISSITTEEAFLQFLASVDAMDTPSVKTHQPLVFVIGTHRDKLGESAKIKIDWLNSHLDLLINKSGFRDLVQYADRHKGQVMFTVDNTSESDEDFKLIRSKVNSMIIGRKDFTIKYPIRYLLFCLELQNLKRSVLSLDECKVMAAKYGIEEDQLVHLLQFLHLRIGVIRYFDKDGVRHIVIKEPQLLFNKVTDLIVKTFSSEALTDVEADNFETKGILTASAFANVVSIRDGISSEEFLHLLVQLRITALFNEPGKQAKEKKYFIPSVLNHVPESSERRHTPILPLAIKFGCKHCPKGLFGVLVTHLMTPNLSEGATTTFTLMQDKIFKDQVSFEVRSPGVHDEMTLRALPSHLEISLFPEHSEDRETPVSEVCSNVRQIMETSIHQSLQDLHYSRSRVAPVICFRCEDKDCFDLHEVEILEKGKKLKIYCEKTHSSYCIPANGQCWYGTGQYISQYTCGNSTTCCLVTKPGSLLLPLLHLAGLCPPSPACSACSRHKTPRLT